MVEATSAKLLTLANKVTFVALFFSLLNNLAPHTDTLMKLKTEKHYITWLIQT